MPIFGLKLLPDKNDFDDIWHHLVPLSGKNWIGLTTIPTAWPISNHDIYKSIWNGVNENDDESLPTINCWKFTYSLRQRWLIPYDIIAHYTYALRIIALVERASRDYSKRLSEFRYSWRVPKGVDDELRWIRALLERL